jgi:hypothetical protein
MITYNEVDFYPIPNIEKYYISKCGKVLSIRSPSGKEKAGKEYRHLMKIKIRQEGYKFVRFNYISKNPDIHRLLARTFLSDFNEKLQVDHIDRDKLNNDLSNLRMVTASDNQRNKKNALGYRITTDNIIRAHWYDDGCELKSKGFSINTYGFGFAFLLATNVREEMVDKYYNRV